MQQISLKFFLALWCVITCLLTTPAQALARDTPRAGVGLVSGPVGIIGLGGSIWLGPRLTLDYDSTYFPFVGGSFTMHQAGVSARAAVAESASSQHNLLLRANLGASRATEFGGPARWDMTYGGGVGYAYLYRNFEVSIAIGTQKVTLGGQTWLPATRLSFLYLFDR
jgi:hypothetical protein